MEYEVTNDIEAWMINAINLKLVAKFLKRIKYLTMERQETIGGLTLT